MHYVLLLLLATQYHKNKKPARGRDFDLFYDHVDCRLDLLAAVEAHRAHVLEGDCAALEREERVVLAEADIEARDHLGAPLADDDGALLGYLAGKELNAEVF